MRSAVPALLGPRRARRAVAAVGLAGVLALAMLAACGGNDDGLDARLTDPGPTQEGGSLPTAKPEAGQPVPTSTFEPLAGGDQVSLADYRGTPLVVNVWASWCGPCLQEMPAFQEVHSDVGDQVAFVGVNSRDDRTEARAVARKTGVTYDLLYDPTAGFVADTGVVAFPSTLFVRPDGTVAEIHAGALSAGELRSKLQELFGT